MHLLRETRDDVSYLDLPTTVTDHRPKLPRLIKRIFGGEWSYGERARFEAFQRGKRTATPRGYVYHVGDVQRQKFIILASPFLPDTRVVCEMAAGVRPPSGSYVELTGDWQMALGTTPVRGQPASGQRFFLTESFSTIQPIIDRPELSLRDIQQEIVEPNWEDVLTEDMARLATLEYISAPPISTTRGGFQLGLRTFNKAKQPGKRLTSYLRKQLPVEFRKPWRTTMTQTFRGKKLKFTLATPYALEEVNYYRLSNYRDLPDVLEPCRVLYVDGTYRRKKLENQLEFHGDSSVFMVTYPARRRRSDPVPTLALLRSTIAYLDLHVQLTPQSASYLTELHLEESLTKIFRSFDLQEQATREPGLLPATWVDIDRVTRLAAANTRGRQGGGVRALTVRTAKRALDQYLRNYEAYLELHQEFNPSFSGRQVLDLSKLRLRREEVDVVRVFRIYDKQNDGLRFQEVKRFLKKEELASASLPMTLEKMVYRQILLLDRDFATGEPLYRIHESRLD